MNRNETKLIVESWRELLEGKRSLLDEGIDYLNEERLDEGVKENILMSIIALSSVLPFNAAKASPRGDLRNVAGSAFDEMDSRRNTDSGAERGDRSGLNDRSREAFDEMDSELAKVKIYITILKEAGMSERIGQKALGVYMDGDGRQKAALVLYLREKLNSVDPGLLGELDNKTGGEKYQQHDKEVAKNTGSDNKGMYIVLPNGKKYRLKHSETHETNVIGDPGEVADQEAMRRRYNSK